MKHYEFLVHVSETIEVAEESFCGGARLFVNEGMRVQNVRMGYEKNESYLTLSGKTGDVASMDAFFELQTIVQPSETVTPVKPAESSQKADEASKLTCKAMEDEPWWAQTEVEEEEALEKCRPSLPQLLFEAAFPRDSWEAVQSEPTAQLTDEQRCAEAWRRRADALRQTEGFQA